MWRVALTQGPEGIFKTDFISYEVYKSLPNYLNDTCMSLSLHFVHVNETRLDAHALLFSLPLLVTKILSDNMEHPVRIFTNVRKDAKTSK